MTSTEGHRRSSDTVSITPSALQEVRATAEAFLEDLEVNLYTVYEQQDSKLPHPSHWNEPKQTSDAPEDLLNFELDFERFQSDFGDVPLSKIPADEQKTKASQTDLGEPALRSFSALATSEDFTQTIEFAYLTSQKGHRVFSSLYPSQPKVLGPRALPSGTLKGPRRSSTDSENHSVSLAVPPSPDPSAPQQCTESRDPPTTRGRQLRNLLLPKPQEPPKSQSYWTGSSFEGKFDPNNNFESGKYTYPSGPVYIGDFQDGKLQSGNATLTYPRGDTLKGDWHGGRFTDGKITFYDGLQFEPFDWAYLSGNGGDRRLHIEATGRTQVGGLGAEALVNNSVNPPPKIPVGFYNVGDGLYNAADRSLTTYHCQFIRKATDFEHCWIVQNCAQQQPKTVDYKPSFADFRITDVYARAPIC